MKLTIGHLYPELLNFYGDRGNIEVLKKRLEWRGIEAEVKTFALENEIDFSKMDILLLGGGADREQQAVCNRLLEMKEALSSYIEEGGVLLALCGGYPILGESYAVGMEKAEGLALLKIQTEPTEKRFISDIVIDSDYGKIVGFENHSGCTNTGDHTPLGKVLCGNGNNGTDSTEGVVYKNVFGTYLHGPLLPKNPKLADEILRRALKHRYGTDELSPLDDTDEMQANEYMVKRLMA